MRRSNAGVIGPKTSSTSTAASGMWSMVDAQENSGASQWPVVYTVTPDPYYDYVTLLVNGENSSNGATNNTITDASGNGFPFTNTGFTTGTPSPYSSADSTYFTTGNYLTITGATSLSTGNYTIEAWVNSTSLSVNNCIFSLGTSDSAGSFIFYIEVTTGILRLYSQGYILTSASGLITPGQWYHIALVRNGTTSTIYLNGVSVASGTGYTTTATTYEIGTGYGGVTSGSSYISNLRVVVGTAVYTSNFTPTTAPLSAITGTSLLACASSRFIDTSPNAFAITVTGSPKISNFSPFLPTSGYTTATNGGSFYTPGGAYITTSNTQSYTSTTNFTFEGWAYLTSETDNLAFFATSSAFSLVQSTGGLILQSYDGSFHSWGYTVPLNQWFWMTMQRSGTTAYVWVNGIYKTSFTFTGTWQWNTLVNGIAGQPSVREVGWFADYRFSNIARYNTSGSNITVPTAPLATDANTVFQITGTNAGIQDVTQEYTLQTSSTGVSISTAVYKYGTGSINFNGTTGYLTGISPPAPIVFGTYTNAWTIELWVNPTAVNVTQYLIDTRSSTASTTGLAFYISTTGYPTVIVNNATLFTSSTALSAGVWTHLALVNVAGTVTLYINGTKPSTGSNGFTATLSDQNLRIGATAGTAASFYGGYMDDIRLTAGVSRYTANFVPPQGSLVTY